MNVAIMQPCYLPWHGYFSLMHHCDVFVHLDDAALPTGRTYQTRIGVKTAQGKGWLTVPVRRVRGQLIRDVEIVEDEWRRKHAATLEQLFRDSSPEVILELLKGEQKLAKLNVSLAGIVARKFGLEREERWSSDMGLEARGSTRIVEICKLIGATRYVTAHGSRNYLDHEAMEDAGIEVMYLEYCLDAYPQPWGEFDPYVSALTVLEHAENPEHWLKSELIPWRTFVKKHALAEMAAK